jgi:hypothetical protein
MLSMFTALLLASGAFWTLTYILMIKRGFQDKTYGMPLAALGANLSWEFIFTFIHPHGAPQIYVNFVWFAFDVVILFELLKFGPFEFPYLSTKLFYAIVLLAFVTGFCSVLFITYEFKDWNGAYAAFGQNLMMSILFVDMLLRRGSLRGQSIYIALCKMIGTMLASLAFYRFASSAADSVLLPFLYLAILIFDAIYVVMIFRKCREQNLDLWKRF